MVGTARVYLQPGFTLASLSSKIIIMITIVIIIPWEARLVCYSARNHAAKANNRQRTMPNDTVAVF